MLWWKASRRSCSRGLCEIHGVLGTAGSKKNNRSPTSKRRHIIDPRKLRIMVRAFSYFVVLWMLLLPVSSFQQRHLAQRQPRANKVLPKGHGYNTINSKLQGLTPLQSVAVACLLPTSLGFLKVEYAVSYGYGAAVALTALLADQAKSLHAMALVFYGVRLCVFLLYREVFIPRFRKFRENIEAKRGSKNRLTRLPVILSCATLYGCMAAPVWITASAAGEVVRTKVFQACVATAWFGFVLGALGDLQKSFVKSQLGEDRLVAGGTYALLRHPNYTGELIGWTANLAAGIVATQKQQWPLLAASVFGWVGITFVLMQAATGLEKKQREKYGELPAYKDWVASSWAGPTFKTTSD